MTEVRAFYLGFAHALAYAQAWLDRPNGTPTIRGHLDWVQELSPDPSLDPREQLDLAFEKLNEDAVILYHRWYVERRVLHIEIASTEGYHGFDPVEAEGEWY